MPSAAGRAPGGGDAVAAVIEALAGGDTAAALAAADAAARAGQEPRILAEALLSRLRNAFLASVEAPMAHVPASERAAAVELATRLRPRVFTFAMELLGQALVQMREAPDPRVDLDLALVRLTNPDIGVTLHSLAERVERLEQGGASGLPPTGGQGPASAGSRPAGASPSAAGSRSPAPAQPGPDSEPSGQRPARGESRFAAAREATARARAGQPAAPDEGGPPAGLQDPAPGSERAPSASGPPPAVPAELRGRSAAGESTGGDDLTGVRTPPGEAAAASPAPAAPPDRDEAVLAWASDVLPSLPKGARALLAGGRFLPNTPHALRLGLPTPGFLARCEPHRPDVEAAFGRCFDRPVVVEFVRDDGGVTAPPTVGEGGGASRSSLLGEVVAPSSRPAQRPAEVDRSGVEQVQQAFPGARLIELEASP